MAVGIIGMDATAPVTATDPMPERALFIKLWIVASVALSASEP
jgi:hypothetical protein